MADSLADGRTRVTFAPAVANIAAPTTSEANAGVLLQTVITADGLVGFEASTAEVDTSALSSTFDTKTIGRDSFSGTLLRLKKQTGTDTAYTTLTRGTEGYLIIRRDVTESTSWSAAQSVEVYPVIVGRRRNLPPEANSVRKYEVPLMIHQDPNLDAVMA
ncbi:hypothetical protein ACFP2T_16490 [Plantactinospora solaniradicis]|uniref:Phage tail protein n=1 Tax=Plantactinospora solaniradicis TaxID=1723736 RepID=A0ABW1K895_9ACTN